MEEAEIPLQCVMTLPCLSEDLYVSYSFHVHVLNKSQRPTRISFFVKTLIFKKMFLINSFSQE